MAEANLAGQETGAMGFWYRYRLPIIVAAIGLAIIGWLYVSKGMAVREVAEAAAAQRATLLQQAAAQQKASVKQSLTMFGVPLAWAIRREMMAENLDQVDQYVIDLVKQKGFMTVVVAKADGLVAVASDRKHVGAAFSTLYAEGYLGAEQISAEETAPGKWLLIVPVMGLNARLGTVAIDYQAPPATIAQ